MHRIALAVLALAVVLTGTAQADPWKDESGHGRGGEWTQEYRSGTCKVERKLERGGAYKEEIECDGPPWAFGYGGSVLDLPPPPPGPIYGEVYRDDRGVYCREYRTTGVIDGRRERLYGTACLQADGSWAFSD